MDDGLRMGDPCAERRGDVRIQGEEGMFVERGLYEGAGQAHDGGSGDPKTHQKPGMGKTGTLARAQVLLEPGLSGEQAPEQGAGHADE